MTATHSTHPLDFPQVWQKPSFRELFDCLQRLKLEPPVWGAKTSGKKIVEELEQHNVNTAQHRQAVAAYLSTLIKSSLSWITDDEQKEGIWEETSRRLSERCGRAGMGEITRNWSFSFPSAGNFTLSIREPPLTGDSLGLKTWCSSYVMAQQLPMFLSTHLAHLFPSNAVNGTANDSNGSLGNGNGKNFTSNGHSHHTNGATTINGNGKVNAGGSKPATTSNGHIHPNGNTQASSPNSNNSTNGNGNHTTPITTPTVLELGSGTGLLGLATAICFRTPVVLTDLPTILPNLTHNVEANTPLIASLDGSAFSEVLIWGNEDEDDHADNRANEEKQRYEVIVVADPLYDLNHPSLLASTIEKYLSPTAGARVVLTVPLRDETTKSMLRELRGRMEGGWVYGKDRLAGGQAVGGEDGTGAEPGPLVCFDEGIVKGVDDWDPDEEEDDESRMVECWWGVFMRRTG